MEHVKQNPWAEACWYFPDTREQFRLGGELTIVGPDHPDAHLREVSAQLRPSCFPRKPSRHSCLTRKYCIEHSSS